MKAQAATLFAISPHQAASRSYGRALRDEIEFHRLLSPDELGAIRINHPAIASYKARLLGGASRSAEYADWTQFLLPAIGPQANCLSLGAGIGRVEEYLIRIGFTPRFQTIELNPVLSAKARAASSSIETIDGDLNFVSLEEGRFDFILCHSILHHLINHEHVLAQVNAALRPGGHVLIYEYIGPDRWQFSDETMRLLRARFPRVSFKVPPAWGFMGFESIRSSELAQCINAQFGSSCVRQVQYGGAYFPFAVASDQFSEELAVAAVALDEEAREKHLLPPCYMMGLYQKSDAIICDAVRWSDADVARRCQPVVPPLESVKRRIKRSRIGPALFAARRALRNFK